MFCLQFLKQFGEIEDCQIDENNLSAVITYKSRAEAEQVSHLSGTNTLKHSWVSLEVLFNIPIFFFHLLWTYFPIVGSLWLVHL